MIIFFVEVTCFICVLCYTEKISAINCESVGFDLYSAHSLINNILVGLERIGYGNVLHAHAQLIYPITESNKYTTFYYPYKVFHI